MTTAIQMAPRSDLAPAETYFTEAQEQMILKTFLGGATKEEAVVLLETVRRRRLDPFSRQVYFVKRYDTAKREEVWAIQTSIDGLRSIADRTGRYEGQTKPEWCGADGVWRDVWLDSKPPAASRVGVYKTGFREAAYGVARHDAYVQRKKDGSPTSFWIKMPDLMLAKCAEALAIRKAFPEDTGGLYVPEEMGQEKDEAPALPAAEAPRAAHTIEVVRPTDPPKEHAPAKANNPRVAVLWRRCIGDFGEEAKARFESAAKAHFGGTAKPSTDWTADDVIDIENALFPAPKDIDY